MALTDRYALLEYNVPGAVVFHERWILDHISNDDYIVVTPDEDIYCECMSVLNQDLRSFRIRPTPNTLPHGVAAGQVYALPAWGAADLARLRGLAAAEAVAERGRQGLAGAQPVPAAVAAPVAAAVAGAPVGETAEDAGPGARNVPSGTVIWVAAETCGGFQYGELVAGVVAVATVGAKTVHTTADGKSLFCECIDASGVLAFNNRPSRCDGRLLPVTLNPLGLPERSLADVVAESKEFPVKWKLAGPRTSRWCLAYLSVEGLGFEAHHERFRQLCKLDGGAWGVQEHFQLSLIIRQLVQVDFINGCNSLGIELMFRRLQTIEYAHSEKARELEARNVGGKLSLEEQYTFGSLVRQAGTLMIAPSLLEHVKAEVQKDVELQKNMRKAREERELSKKKGKKEDP
jgi:hypothetical protein